MPARLPHCAPSTGDSRVLMLKMARDRLRKFAKDAKSGTPVPASQEAEAELCASLAKALGTAKGDKAAEAAVWDKEWQSVYGLAEAIMARTTAEVMA